MRKLTSSTQLAAFLFVDSRWHEPQDAVQCLAHGSTFEFLFQFQTEFFFSSNFLFHFQVVRASNLSTIEGPLYYNIINVIVLTLDISVIIQNISPPFHWKTSVISVCLLTLQRTCELMRWG